MRHPTLLARLTAERRWTYAEAVEEFAATARSLGLKHSVSERQWQRWCVGEVQGLPRPGCCKVLEHMFRVSVEVLLRPAGEQRAEARLDLAAIRTAADEAVEHVARTESAQVGPATLEQIHDDVVRLARGYASTPPWETFCETVNVRRRTCDLIEVVRRPDQLRNLHLILGQLCSILSSTSFDLGYDAEAERQSRAAWAYGEHIGHDGLRAWARGSQALIAYWAGRPREAVELARSAQGYLRGGSGMVRAKCIEARAWSHMNGRKEVEQVLIAASHARDGDGYFDDMLDGIGGEYAFDPARQARCAGSAYVQLGDAEAAIHHASIALDLYRQAGSGSMKVMPQARVDLAAAHLINGDLDGAQHELSTVLTLPAEHRINGLVQRMGRVTRLLGGEVYADIKTASELREQLVEFQSRPAVPALSAGPAQPAIG